MLQRAYGFLHIKSLDDDRRLIRGIASTPEPDRMGDIIEPLGITYRNPLPLLLYHNPQKPVGQVRFHAPTVAGLEFEAELPTVTEPGTVRERIEEAWTSIKAGLLAGVSIGFRPLEEQFHKATGGFRFTKSEVLELSLVAIPANPGATIHTIKALDLAASGLTSPGVSGLPVVRASKEAPAMTNQTTTEQITAFENTRAAKAGRMTAIMQAAAETHTTLDAPQTEEYDGLESEVKSIDAHLVRLRALEKTQLAQATPITATTAADASAQRAAGTGNGNGNGRVIQVKSNVPSGTAFVRYTCAMLACKGNYYEAAEYAKRWDDSTPEVSLQLKAAVAPGNATDSAWAGPLVSQTIASDFIELLRPATILGKIPGLRRVPFNTKVPSQTAGGTYGWVGEAKPKPVTKLAFSAETLTISKAAGIIVLTEELVRLSNPSAETLVRADMIAGIAQFLDQQFIDPAVAAVAGVNPASITNGAPSAAATTDPLADLLGLVSYFATNNVSVSGLALIMSETNALALSFQRNPDGSASFPAMGAQGGTLNGINVVTSQAAGTNVIAVQPSLILYADDGAVTIDASREASLQMDSAPASPPDATTVLVSLWQNNLVGLRAERFINWKRIGASVKYLTAAAYPAGFAMVPNAPNRTTPKAS